MQIGRHGGGGGSISLSPCLPIFVPHVSVSESPCLRVLSSRLLVFFLRPPQQHHKTVLEARLNGRAISNVTACILRIFIDNKPHATGLRNRIDNRRIIKQFCLEIRGQACLAEDRLRKVRPAAKSFNFSRIAHGPRSFPSCKTTTWPQRSASSR